LTAQDDGGILLELTVKFRSSAFSFPMFYDYSFALRPGSVERVHALEEHIRDRDRKLTRLEAKVVQLEAKILEQQQRMGYLGDLQRQQQEELDRVHQELERLHLELQDRHIVQLEARRIDDSSSVCWRKMESPGVTVEEGSQVVIIRRADLYQIYGLVSKSGDGLQHAAWFVKNGRKLRQSLTVAISEQDQVMTLLIALVPLEEGDNLVVKCTSDSLSLRHLYVWGASNRT